MIVDKPFIDMLVIIMNKKKNFTKLQFQNPFKQISMGYAEDVEINISDEEYIKLKEEIEELLDELVEDAMSDAYVEGNSQVGFTVEPGAVLDYDGFVEDIIESFERGLFLKINRVVKVLRNSGGKKEMIRLW